MEQRWAWAPGTAIIERDRTHIQFGIDATRAGVVAVPDAAAAAQAWRTLPAALSATDWLERSPLAAPAAQLLLEELIDYGILAPVQPPPALHLVGDGVLAEHIEDLGAQAGWTIRRWDLRALPGRTATLPDPSHPVVVIDGLPHAHQIAQALASPHYRAIIPVSSIDNRGLIGPVRLAGQGACLLCFNLFMTAKDPRWNIVIRAAGIPTADPLVQRATATATAVLLRLIWELPLPPASALLRPSPGQVQEINIFGRDQRQLIGVHPRCPVCYESQQ